MYKKIQEIISFEEGDIISDIFVIKEKKNLHQFSNNTKFRLDLRLADSSGTINLKLWNKGNEYELQELYNSIKIDDVVFIQGKISEFNNYLEINSNFKNNELKILSQGEFEPGSFINRSKKNVEELYSQLINLVNSVQNIKLKNVLNLFFSDKEFIGLFKTMPASVYRHCSYIGGLLKHTLEISLVCEKISSVYPEIDRDLLITGAILHDIGKIRQFKFTNKIDYTNKGSLIGSIYLGVKMFDEKVENLLIPDLIKLKLRHMLLSNLGKKEYGAAKEPSFPEALVLSKVKELCSKTSFMLKLKKENVNSGSNYFYNKTFGNIFLK